jgi:SAM-dependent methyltransferase
MWLWSWVTERIARPISEPRARDMVGRLAGYLPANETVLDIGCGDGRVGVMLKLMAEQQVTMIDLEPAWSYVGMWLFGVPWARLLARRHGLDYTLYTGDKLPFADGSSDTCLLAYVMHHAKNPEALFAEAARVSRGRVVVFEDVPRAGVDMRRSHWGDVVANLDLAHADQNRTREEWLELFARYGFRVVYEQAYEGKLYGFTFPNHVFVLERNA